jgi:hypothetical protein
MATSGDLIGTISTELKLPEHKVSYIYRQLRDAGAVTKGGRGRSAANITPLDASRLLIASLGVHITTSSPTIALREFDLELAGIIEPHATVVELFPNEWDLAGYPISPGEEARHIPLLSDLRTKHTFAPSVADVLAKISDNPFAAISEDGSHNDGLSDVELRLSAPAYSSMVRVFIFEMGILHSSEAIFSPHNFHLSSPQPFSVSSSLGTSALKAIAKIVFD